MELKQFENKIGYRFKNKRLIETAFCHSSFVNEQSSPDLSNNERLEFLGDAVLSLVASDVLMERYPHVKEGDLSRMRPTRSPEVHVVAARDSRRFVPS